MPIYEYQCNECKGIIEKLQHVDGEPPLCCGKPTTKKPTEIALFKMKGMGYPSRRKWMDKWSPKSPAFSTGSIHGAHY